MLRIGGDGLQEIRKFEMFDVVCGLGVFMCIGLEGFICEGGLSWWIVCIVNV